MPRGRVIGRTSAGPWRLETEKAVLMPLPSALSLLNDHAHRAVSADAEVASSLARHTSGVDAWAQHQFLLGQVVAPLRYLSATQRVLFALLVADHIDSHPDNEGLESVLAAAVNAIWLDIPDPVAVAFTRRVRKLCQKSRFAKVWGVTLYDPASHSVSVVSRAAMVGADLTASLEDPWRKRARQAAARAKRPPTPALTQDGLRAAIEKALGPGARVKEGDGGTVDYDAWRQRVEKQLGLNGDWSGPSVRDFERAAEGDLGGAGGGPNGGAWAVPGLGQGQRAYDYTKGPGERRGPLTKADLSDRGFVSEGELNYAGGVLLVAAGTTLNVLGTAMVAVGVGQVALTGLPANDKLIVGSAVVFLGSMTTQLGDKVKADAAKKTEEAKQPAPKPAPKHQPNPMNEGSITSLNKVLVDKWLKTYAKTHPGGLFGKTSDTKEQWQPVDKLDGALDGVVFKVVDPLDDPVDMFVAEERPTRGDDDVDEDVRKKVQMMVLERKVYRLPSGMGMTTDLFHTPVGVVLP